MRETWLKTNRRAILFGCLPPVILGAIGTWLAMAGDPSSRWRWYGIIVIAVSASLICLLLLQLRRPRVAFSNGNVCFYLRRGEPIAVPVEIVESFFAGQSPAHLPGMTKQPQTVNLIARLSQRHKEWAQQTVKPTLGQWCDGYVTIRGTWCEPLDAEVIRWLNRRLKEVKDETNHLTDDDRSQS
jgi:hypothetical protein